MSGVYRGPGGSGNGASDAQANAIAASLARAEAAATAAEGSADAAEADKETVENLIEGLQGAFLGVHQFGAAGVDASADTAAIQAACTFLAVTGGTVFFPDIGAPYLLNDCVDVPEGVNLAGPGSVRRTHGLSVNNYAFTLNGNNKVSGLAYDGGSTTIVSPGLALSIKDFMCLGDNISFEGNTLANSCGSYIGFANQAASTLSGLIVQGNTFGDYFDHAIYCQGYGTVETGRVVISGNNFTGTAATTTRQAVKIKNITGASIADNAINLPNGIFATVETGLDFPVVASDCRDISITGNVGTCVKFIESICATDANNDDFMVRNLTITGNSVTCTSYVVNLGLVAAPGTAFATRASGVMISGNTFVGAHGININGDLVNFGIENVSIVGNTISVSTGITILQLWGNVTGLVFARNTCTMTAAYAATNAVWNNANLVGTSGQTAYIPTAAGVYDISDNVLLGNFGCIAAEAPASAITALNMTCVIRGNRNISTNTSKREVVFNSTALASATGLFYLENNLSIGGTTTSNVCAVQALVTGLVKVGSGTSGLLVRPNTSNNGVALYSSNVTPDATNFAVQATATFSILNGASSAILQVANSTKLAVNSSGVTVHGALGAGSAAPTIASSGTIAPTTMIAFVSGTTLINTITPPGNMATTGGVLILIPTGLWTTGTAGNIAVASTAVVSKPLMLFYDNSGGGKWYPSY